MTAARRSAIVGATRHTGARPPLGHIAIFRDSGRVPVFRFHACPRPETGPTFGRSPKAGGPGTLNRTSDITRATATTSPPAPDRAPAHTPPGPPWHARLAARVHARLAGLSRPARGFTLQPEPHGLGSFARGRQFIAGNYLLDGRLVRVPPGTPLFQLPESDPAFLAEAHGFGWLDDLAAAGDAGAKALAQAWLADWIAVSKGGRGPGWAPELCGHRVLRWISHALFLMADAPVRLQRAYLRSLSRQTIYLARRWKAAEPGRPRLEALTGLLVASVSLDGLEKYRQRALAGLTAECDRTIAADGTTADRNPEELLAILTLLGWAEAALTEAGEEVPAPLTATISRIAPVLRALAHADGGLARFHGGDRGTEGQLDRALAASGARHQPPGGPAMGFARILAGRTSVIMDAAAPPTGPASRNAHASTLAFELTSGRRPLIVSCGPGRTFGPGWRAASRTTAAHSTLDVAGVSSSHAPAGRDGLAPDAPFAPADVPQDVRILQTRGTGAFEIVAEHDGYVPAFGLTHMRRIELTDEGRTLTGEDLLAAMTAPQRATLEAALARAGPEGLRFAARFHLHPDVEVEYAPGARRVGLHLRSGETWLFRHDGAAELTVEPGVYLEAGRRAPRPSAQIVLAGRVLDLAGRVRWSLAKADGVPDTVRDLERPEAPWLEDD